MTSSSNLFKYTLLSTSIQKYNYTMKYLDKKKKRNFSSKQKMFKFPTWTIMITYLWFKKCAWANEWVFIEMLPLFSCSIWTTDNTIIQYFRTQRVAILLCLSWAAFVSCTLNQIEKCSNFDKLGKYLCYILLKLRW